MVTTTTWMDHPSSFFTGRDSDGYWTQIRLISDLNYLIHIKICADNLNWLNSSNWYIFKSNCVNFVNSKTV